MAGLHPLAKTVDSLGCFAHCVRDCLVLDRLMRGETKLPEESDTYVVTPGRWFVVESAILEDPELEPAVMSNFLAAVTLLEAVGCVREAIGRRGWLGAIEAWQLLGGIAKSAEGGRMDRRVSKRLLAGATMPCGLEAELRGLRETLLKRVRDELDGALLLMPTVKHVPPLLAALEADDELFARVNLGTLGYTMIGSFLDIPGLALPVGTDRQGLPTSLLISAPQGHDDEVFEGGLFVEAALR
ncbi:amidase family protein [Pseudomonas sp. CCOS 191]|uniref:amidase family protein n=1 Tax=Pseudomonas sp. CCOS 191 TaxID=1649877 RepID=UPI0006248DC8|nr:amidase family protein [Pseudomonas sp. CCOS 191]CRI59818.1 glutamyl-tRNA amidotransferase subunit A [Pseudomonas sp. CCOS 191]